MGDIQPGNRATTGKSVTTPEDDSIVKSSVFIVIKDPMGRARVEMAPDIDFVALIDTSLKMVNCRLMNW